MGAFKWTTLGLQYKLDKTEPASTALVERVLGQFRDAGCRAR